ncbi:MAG: anion permease [Steroidobacteraceae bacterium]|uniref:inorganic phosphate transporter n=1 Tax=Alcaligenes sp. SMD-FA TaxID=2991054 RepID=UPI0022271631|nr:inorganic phosphate transporter [Alcaligenes sp. SMD-FA]UYY86339.1 inorganic phosphate transporter [Alcaligenes sp. SMD-FA]
MEVFLILAALAVAFSNGANDNFKGFATVWGSETLDYRRALTLATLATVAGSLASLLLAESLVQQFSGKGLVSDVVASAPLFIASVASGTAMTVFLATRLGFPVSTTHALIGGLVGAGLAQNGAVHLDRLASTFLMPLLVSPMLAAALGAVAYSVFRLCPVDKDCACVALPEPAKPSPVDGAVAVHFAIPDVVVASVADCERLDTPVRWSVSRSMDRLHVLSAMAICFARGVNDTPKLTALLLAANLLSAQGSILVITAVMAVGGLLFSRRVAQTMSQRVTRMDHTQGLSANLITAVLVLFASKLGLPVSTTHVSVGAIAGVGANAGTLDWVALRNILLSWGATLPLAMGLAWSIGRIV